MTKVPGAAEELERGAAWLVEEVRSLVVALTGGPAPDVPVLACGTSNPRRYRSTEA